MVQRFGKLTVVDSNKTSSDVLLEDAPPRPPKPSYLGKGASYLNLGVSTSTSTHSKTDSIDVGQSISQRNSQNLDNQPVSNVI